jgi:glyoxylase-like metal-dependent hydrolase (beta-lactamase superfamily II)
MKVTDITRDLAYIRTGFVNLFLHGNPGAGDRGWVLIDAGLPGFTHRVVRAAARRFGAGARPAAIILTHGHYDHIGMLRSLADRWEAPIFAHPLELPFLTGLAAYPPPDPTVPGGMAKLAPLFPKGPFDFRPRVQALPADGAVPGMLDWQWVATPGHTPGHVSLFREVDGALIAGDAFVTTRQESVLSAITYKPEIHGPPAYWTPDWCSSWESVELLAALQPEIAATGHGPPMRGYRMREGLEELARNFDRLAIPPRGRYVPRPLRDEVEGIIPAPAPARAPLRPLAVGLALAAVAGAVALRARR